MKLRPRGAVLCSGGASSLRYLYGSDPTFGRAYEIAGVFSDTEGAGGIDFATQLMFRHHTIDFKKWCTANGASRADLQARERYFAEVLQAVKEWGTDFIMLSGFMLIVTDPLLEAFRGRILNVHPALLSLVDNGRRPGRRKYTGLNVVARAMQAGDPTGSTVHIVTSEPDMGRIVAESKPLPYRAGDNPAAHQDKMKSECDGPAYQAALKKLFAMGWPERPFPGAY